jgi:hypothetical protein
MAELTRALAADKAGVEPGYVDRLIELGIVVPDGDERLTTGDVRRTQMARTLEGAGIGLEALAAGMRSGRLSLGFMDTPAYQRFATLSDETFRTGERAIRRAAGATDSRPRSVERQRTPLGCDQDRYDAGDESMSSRSRDATSAVPSSSVTSSARRSMSA